MYLEWFECEEHVGAVSHPKQRMHEPLRSRFSDAQKPTYMSMAMTVFPSLKQGVWKWKHAINFDKLFQNPKG